MNKYVKLILTYGWYPMLAVLKEQEEDNNFEICADIKEAFDHLKIEIKESSEEDYVQEFWRLGYSGQTALANVNYYIESIKAEL